MSSRVTMDVCSPCWDDHTVWNRWPIDLRDCCGTAALRARARAALLPRLPVNLHNL